MYFAMALDLGAYCRQDCSEKKVTPKCEGYCHGVRRVHVLPAKATGRWSSLVKGGSLFSIFEVRNLSKWLMLEKVWALVLALEQINVVKLHYSANLFRYDEYAVRACREGVTIELVNHVRRFLRKGRKVDESGGKHIYVGSSKS